MKLYAVQGCSLKASYPTGQTRQQLLYPIESLASEAYAWQFVGSCEHDLQARRMGAINIFKALVIESNASNVNDFIYYQTGALALLGR